MLFRTRLRSLNDIEGENFDLVFRLADTDDPAQVAAMAAEIVASRPDIIVAVSNSGVDALRALTHSIPIVVVFSGDPVPLGYSTSWALRPGHNGGNDRHRNINGQADRAAARTSAVARVFGLVFEPANPLNRVVLQRTEAALQSSGLELRRYPIVNAGDVAQVPARAVAEHVAALIVAPSTTINDRHAELIPAATGYRLPTMHSFNFEAIDGAVIFYGTDQDWNWQRCADYVHRLLHGARVAELPFEENDHVVLTLNLKTAHAIGLDVPASIVARANEVID